MSLVREHIITVDLSTQVLDSTTNVDIDLSPFMAGVNGEFSPLVGVSVRTNSPTGGDATNDVDMHAYVQRAKGNFEHINDNKLYFIRYNTALASPATPLDIYSGATPGIILISPRAVMTGTGSPRDHVARTCHPWTFISFTNAALNAVRHDAGGFTVTVQVYGW